jgi:hypothetical protein
MKYLIAILFMLSACTETRSEKQTEKHVDNDVRVSGNLSIPTPTGMAPVAIDLLFQHTGNEGQKENTESTTKIDAAAIGKQLGETVAQAIKTALSATVATSVPGSGLLARLSTTEGVLGTGMGGALLYAIREMLERRRREKSLEEVKRDRDEGWEKAVKYAEKVDPKTLDDKNMGHA